MSYELDPLKNIPQRNMPPKKSFFAQIKEVFKKKPLSPPNMEEDELQTLRSKIMEHDIKTLEVQNKMSKKDDTVQKAKETIRQQEQERHRGLEERVKLIEERVIYISDLLTAVFSMVKIQDEKETEQKGD